MELNQCHRQALLNELHKTKQAAEEARRIAQDTKLERDARDFALVRLFIANASIDTIEVAITLNVADL